MLGSLAFGGSAQGARNVGTYAITPGGVYSDQITPSGRGGYAIDFVSGSLAITPAPLTIAVGSDSRMYNGSTSSMGTPTVSGLQSGDGVTGLSQAFASKNVLGAGNSTLNVIGYTVNDGNRGANYAVTTQSAPGTITPASLTVTGASAADKVYDGASVASVSGGSLRGAISGDVVTLNTGAMSGSFADKNIGSAKAVTVSGALLAGTDSSNYSLVQPAGLSADITSKTITVAGASAANKVYDGTSVASVSGGSLSGAISGDVVTLNSGAMSGSFADKNVGSAKAVSVSGALLAGTDSSNYSLVQPAGLSADITPKTITVAGASAANKVYDGTSVASVSGGSLSGVVSGDAVALNSGAMSGSFADKNVGSAKAVSVSGALLAGTDSSNYSLVQPAEPERGHHAEDDHGRRRERSEQGVRRHHCGQRERRKPRRCRQR